MKGYGVKLCEAAAMDAAACLGTNLPTSPPCDEPITSPDDHRKGYDLCHGCAEAFDVIMGTVVPIVKRAVDEQDAEGEKRQEN